MSNFTRAQYGLWRSPTLAACLLLTAGTTAICWRLITSPFQFAINDLDPFGPQMLTACPLNYVNEGLGRQNPHFSPSYCDFGLLATLLGGVNAQHVFVIGCFALAGISMLLLLRRIGNSTGLSLIGAIAYELSPIMLSFQQSGEGLLLTAALLPAILLGAVPIRGHPTIADGARSGALLAILSYANAQAPVLVVFLLAPIVGLTFLRKYSGARRALKFAGGFAVAFLAAAVPIFQILSGFGAAVQGAQAVLESDFLARLAWSTPLDFFAPYLYVGAVPVATAIILRPFGRDMKVAERAAMISLASVLALWETLRFVGPSIAQALPILTLYKDFIKLEIVVAVPLVLLSVSAIRWALLAQGVPAPLKYPLAVTLSTLVVLPIAIGQQPRQIYATDPQSPLGGEAILSGQLGLPEWSAVPVTYSAVLDALARSDPDTRNYRVLWTPIDWRLFQLSRATSINLLLYYSDGSPESRAAVSRTFSAIANGERDQIAPMLADEGVKYVVVDLADGQGRNSEPWEKGPPVALQVAGTVMLAGQPEGYKAIMSNSPGLKVMQDARRWVVYRNLEWRPILKSYSAILAVPSNVASQAKSTVSAVSLSWTGLPGVHWRQLPDSSVQVQAFDSQSGQTPWAPVHAVIPVVPGASYRFMGQMDYEHVIQAHAKVMWRGNVAPQNVTTFLINGLDGVGVATLDQTAVAPPGASTAEILLMGGWAQNPGGFTRYLNMEAGPVVSPDLSTLAGHPDRLQSLWQQFPDLLIESGSMSISSLSGVSVLPLGEGEQATRNEVRLLTVSDMVVSGKWVINALPDLEGIEHFTNLGGGTLSMSRDVLDVAPSGSTVVWMEYGSKDLDAQSAFMHSVSASLGTLTIGCQVANCTIANVFLVPPLPRAAALSRLGYAYSPLLRTPSGVAPTHIQGDWSSIYNQQLHDYPSAVNDSTTLARALGLLFGHFAALVGLFFGLLLRPFQRQGCRLARHAVSRNFDHLAKHAVGQDIDDLAC